MTFLYRLFLAFYRAGIHLSSIFGNDKATLWLKGRRDINKKLNALPPGELRAWFHCASLGEFEQGRPVLEAYRKKYPGIKLVLTFFSPSGYEVRKNYAGADYIFYLPLDGSSSSRRFIHAVNPQAAFFVKYDFWYYYLHYLRQRAVPVYIISAAFRPGQAFFKWYGGFFRKMLRCVTRFYLQDENSGKLLSNIGLTNHVLSGDTRFDRVKQVASGTDGQPLLAEFASQAEVLVAGSTWPEDEKLIAALLPAMENLKLIIAPHEVSEDRIREVVRSFPGALLFSQANTASVKQARVIILDSIGKLSAAYRYGRFAFIGGGFGKGIHNILEAAVYGQPVFFGPHFQKFREAVDLLRLQGAVTVSSSGQLIDRIGDYKDASKYAMAAEASASYVSGRAGATEKILATLE